MRPQTPTLLRNFNTLLIALACSAVLQAPMQAQTFTVIHNFTGGADGHNPSGTLSIDAAGNLAWADLSWIRMATFTERRNRGASMATA